MDIRMRRIEVVGIRESAVERVTGGGAGAGAGAFERRKQKSPGDGAAGRFAFSTLFNVAARGGKSPRAIDCGGKCSGEMR